MVLILVDLFKKQSLIWDNSEIQNKIPDTSGLVKKTDHNVKITEIESKIPSITGLATNAALTVVENKIPNIINL